MFHTCVTGPICLTHLNILELTDDLIRPDKGLCIRSFALYDHSYYKSRPVDAKRRPTQDEQTEMCWTRVEGLLCFGIRPLFTLHTAGSTGLGGVWRFLASASA